MGPAIVAHSNLLGVVAGRARQSEAEECIKRIQSHKGVKWVFITNHKGQIIKSTVQDADHQRKYASLISELTTKTRSMIRELDPDNTLKFLRIRTNTEEIMIAPEPNNQQYTLVVGQDPSEDDPSF
jgi:dynein light chain roadblock-type